MRRSHFAYLVPVVLAVASAGADEPHLGAAHTVALSIAGSTAQYRVGPALDYFVVDGLSVGVQAGVDLTYLDGNRSDSLFVSGRVGYAFHLGDRLTFWPKVALEYDRGDSEFVTDVAGDMILSTDELYGAIFATLIRSRYGAIRPPSWSTARRSAGSIAGAP